jgi:hypothetical protein
MIPVIGTRFGMIEVGIVSSMVVRDATPPRFKAIAVLVREAAISALVSVQETV